MAPYLMNSYAAAAYAANGLANVSNFNNINLQCLCYDLGMKMLATQLQTSDQQF
jgi:hypothetical protein